MSERWRPFCSERCKLLDLSRWLDGSYRIRGTEPAGSAGSPEPSAPQDEDKTDAADE
ncbi:MAG: DNA gyrase inhibitor YacG [Luteitalea sp.]|nr:DNA gyrase inhibitor YacG [Luteitalea sp.]